MDLLKKALRFYLDGFRSMSLTSRKLWVIVLIKLFIMFGILKVFFFNNTLENNFNTEEEISNHVYNELTKSNK